MGASTGLIRSIKPFGIRLSPDLRKLLEGQASFKGVSLNTWIVSILEEYAHRSINVVERLDQLENQLTALQQSRESYSQ